MCDTSDGTSAVVEGIGERIERVCSDIDELLATIRSQARKLKELGDDERG